MGRSLGRHSDPQCCSNRNWVVNRLFGYSSSCLRCFSCRDFFLKARNNSKKAKSQVRLFYTTTNTKNVVPMVRLGLLASANFSLFLIRKVTTLLHHSSIFDQFFKFKKPIISTVALLVFFRWLDSGHLLASSNYSNFVQFFGQFFKLGLSWADVNLSHKIWNSLKLAKWK